MVPLFLKGDDKCQEVMGRVLWVKAQEQDGIRDKVKVKAKWVDHSLPDRAEIASVRSAAIAHLMLRGSPVIRKRARSAVRP
jgi:hypothetical protein